ncbi:MAG: DUF2293 domain-containing protein [Candidatus Aminicenantes bacterium]|nr:DUF2293 domain-containing protein [Candidatus Aminicenantes bacterium]
MAFELKVFISNRDSRCDECGEDLGKGAWIRLIQEKGALCLSCADLDHLVFLPSGDAALTRRARKYSTLSAVVLKWSRARKRYERQGLLVEEQGLEQAEQECLNDSEIRELQRQRRAEREKELDYQYIKQFAKGIRELYPHCPHQREQIITRHACQKYSGRVGRSAAAKQFDEKTIHLAVAAHIRHQETDYDKLLIMGYERWEAREQVDLKVKEIMAQWANIHGNRIKK